MSPRLTESTKAEINSGWWESVEEEGVVPGRNLNSFYQGKSSPHELQT